MATNEEAKAKQDALSAELGSEKTSDAAKAKAAKDAAAKKGKGEVLTPEAKQKLISDAKAEEGRKWKKVEQERDQLKDTVGTLTTRLDDIESRQTARAYEEAKADPSGNALKNIQADETARKREREVQKREDDATKREAQNKADREEFDTESGASVVAIVASKHGVDAERLGKMGVTDKAALEKIAADMKANTAEAKPLTTEQEAAKKEAEDKGEEYTPTSETPTGEKPMDLTTEGVEAASMESLEKALVPPIN